MAKPSTPCPVCDDGRQVRRLFEKQAIPYHRCLACGFVFSKPAVNANLANDFEGYERSYLQYFAPSDEDERNLVALLGWVEQTCALHGQRVLDVGSGSGKLVRFLRHRGVDAYGLEPAEPLYSRFLASDPFFVHQTIEDYAAGSSGKEFGVIFACDVIEHLERPDLFLRDASRLLRPGGTLIVSTPDVGSVFARVCGKHWHFYNQYHLSYLSRRTLGSMAARYGLREVGHTHLPRLKSVGFLLEYFSNFVTNGWRIPTHNRLDQRIVRLNLFDTMTLAFRGEADSPN